MRDRPNEKHRDMLEQKLGRKLLPKEVADHVDEDKSNNAPANLRPEGRSAHTARHNHQRGGLSKLRSALRMIREKRKLY